MALAIGACSRVPDNIFPGYAEGDYVRLAAPIGGTLAKVYLQRGGHADAAAPAFTLEQESERAAREEAEARLLSASAHLEDLRKSKRPDEIAAARAQLAQAQAALMQSSADLKRQTDLANRHFVSPSAVDSAGAAEERDNARVAELRAQLRVSNLAARPDEIAAANQDVEAARAQVAQAQWRVSQKAQTVPVAGDVIDLLYREGEWVPAGNPVVVLLPPQNLKARFFVAQPWLGKISLNQTVQIHCDSCPAGRQTIAARISFIAHDAEYTVPLIYSRENRASLVFMVEAVPQDLSTTSMLHPGQPLEVELPEVSAGK